MSLKQDPKFYGVFLVYAGKELYFERHEARGLYRDLEEIIKQWDLQQTNAADGRIECICGGRNLPDAKHCWKCRGMIVPARR